MRYNCLIIDDNEIERDLIEAYLSKFSQLHVVAVCEDGIAALQVLSDEDIDIVFSDIDMPDLSGIALLKSIKNPPVFIFVTSHLQHAIEGFELDALDFIMKPLSLERLLKSVNKATAYIDLKRKAIPLSSEKTLNEDGVFFIKDAKGYTRLHYDEIIYVESFGDFSKFFTDQEMHIALVNLKNLEPQLPNSFYRVHKQFIVNFSRIISVSTYEIILENDFKVPLSPSYRDELISLVTDKTLVRSAKK